MISRNQTIATDRSRLIAIAQTTGLGSSSCWPCHTRRATEGFRRELGATRARGRSNALGAKPKRTLRVVLFAPGLKRLVHENEQARRTSDEEQAASAGGSLRRRRRLLLLRLLLR